MKEKRIINSGWLHVYLSENYLTVQDFGSRYGKFVIIVADSQQMYKDGVKFYQSVNYVWLTGFDDVGYFRVMSGF